MNPFRPDAPRKAVAVQVQALPYRHYRLPVQPPLSPFERFVAAMVPAGQRLHSRVLDWLGTRPR